MVAQCFNLQNFKFYQTIIILQQNIPANLMSMYHTAVCQNKQHLLSANFYQSCKPQRKTWTEKEEEYLPQTDFQLSSPARA